MNPASSLDQGRRVTTSSESVTPGSSAPVTRTQNALMEDPRQRRAVFVASGYGWVVSRMPCRCRLGVWLPSDQAARSDPVAAWLETGATAGEHLSSGLPAVASPLARQ